MGGKRGREYGGECAEEEIEYEKLRNARLAENQKRMEELGLVGLSKSLSETVRSGTPSRGRLRGPSESPRVVVPAGPARRSSRLQGSPVVSYAEITKKEGERKEKSAGRRASEAGTGGFQPEIYTEKHEKLLGSATKEWKLFVDGYTVDGKSRIYDPANGKTCHQCRQKTMGLRTWCSSCQSLHGQFCGDCLFMRYGENVLEAIANKKWECPVCRKICNCSFCRLKRGWTPTGSLYRRVKSLGYKSVAHYLILTRRDGNEEAGDNMAPKCEKIEDNERYRKEKDKAENVHRKKVSQKKVGSKVSVKKEDMLTPEGKTMEASVMSGDQASLLTPKPDLEKPDTPEKQQEGKVMALTPGETTSSEDGNGRRNLRRSRRSLDYAPSRTANEGGILDNLVGIAHDLNKDNERVEADVQESIQVVGKVASTVRTRSRLRKEEQSQARKTKREDPPTRGRGRPCKTSLPKESFDASAPRTRTRSGVDSEAGPNPSSMDNEQDDTSILILDSDTEDEERSANIGQKPRITHRPQRRARRFQN